MKGVVMVAALIMLTGCSDKDFESTMEQIDCGPEVTEKIATFNLSCIVGANPMSDEEPEDWIRQCNRVARQTYCKLNTYKIVIRKFAYGGTNKTISKELIK